MYTIVVVLSLMTVLLSNSVAEGGNEALTYLAQFGYLNGSTVDLDDQGERGSFVHNAKVTEAIQEFQRYFGLTVTGVLDERTREEMSAPRCGDSDTGYDDEDEEELDELSTVTRKWLHNDLTYRVSQYSERVDRGDTDRAVEEAFNLWASVTPLTFTRRDFGPVDIDIRFVIGDHGCRRKFDGPGHVLAHAYFPKYIGGRKSEWAGRTHLDNAETWTIDSGRGKNLMQVLTHEFGHALGLKHSDLRATVMFPKYRSTNPSEFKLHDNDVTRIQDLYGESQEAAVNICDDISVDAVFKTQDGQFYLFKGQHYWRKGSGPLAAGLISEKWPGSPDNIDAAFSTKVGKTYFFKGSQFWLYKDNVLEDDYPKAISRGFPGIPDDLDVAIATESEIFFFKGSLYWKFNPFRRPPVSSMYRNGRPIERFWGVPPPLDAGLYVDVTQTFFIKGSSYYRYNNVTRKVDVRDRPLAQALLGCKQ